MARDAIAFFNSLTCNAERDASGGSEPYFWPALVVVDDLTIGTTDRVRVVTPHFSFARIVVGSGMRAGDTATVPNAIRRLQVRLEDGWRVQNLILIVAMFEHDETPTKAVEAGLKAYGPALQSILGARIFELNAAQQAGNEAAFDAIIGEITRAVEAEVRSAAEDALSTSEKVRIFLGTLNLDDTVGTAREFYSPVQADSFSMSFREIENDVAVNDYELNGVLQVQPVPVETCPEEALAVIEAKRGVDAVDAMIELAQTELKTAPPSHKPFWVSEIRRLKLEELPKAEAELDAAKRALDQCRSRPSRPSVILSTEALPVLVSR